VRLARDPDRARAGAIRRPGEVNRCRNEGSAAFRHEIVETGMDRHRHKLWNRLGERLNLHTTFREYQTVREMLDAVSGGSADAAVAAISVTLGA
jgi:hypothetical protein